MNTIKIKYGLEDITSRIPGLFAYLEFDENHVSTPHPASDSDVGCYGKIVCSLKVPENVTLVVDGVDIVNSETEPTSNVYTYRTLMNAYYTYREEYPNNSFIQFMERGIGMIKTPFNEEWTLVPEYEYYANCARLFDEYTKIGIMCEKYEQIKQNTGEINCELECLCEKYKKMGGNTMRDWYGRMAVESNDVAEEYLGYKSNEFNLEYNINIVSRENDLGILNTYLDYFDPKHTYHDGEYTIYNDRTYMCVDAFDENRKYLFGSYTNYNQQGYICIEENGHVGSWDEHDFNLINNVVQLPDNDANFVLLSEDYSQEEHQPISGTIDSVLSGFRKNKNYLDESGTLRLPDQGTDWLWYYAIGDVGYSETTTDMFNNIEIEDGHRRKGEGEDEDHLLAYGDIIKKIERDTINNTITFTYVIGAHLVATLMEIDTDDDGNEHYYYSDYRYDDDDPHGVTYTETYSYEADGEIARMSDVEFLYYINHNKSELVQSGDGTWRYTKAEFGVVGGTSYADRVVDGMNIIYPYVVSEFETKFQAEKDTLSSPLTKFDYLTGIPYNPSVVSDTNISRGNATAWERHIKLGEIKTFEDLETSSMFGVMLRTS